VELSRRDEANNEPHSFFNDLFVGATRPAVGANYNILGYRLRDMDEVCAVHGALDRDFADFNCHCRGLHSNQLSLSDPALSHWSCVAESRALAEIAGVKNPPAQLEFVVPKEMLEVAKAIADVSDVVGLSERLAERLFLAVIAMDRARVDIPI
jgi:hypothetical protein